MDQIINSNQETNLVAHHRKQKLIEYLTKQGVYEPQFKQIIEYLYEKTDYFYGPSSTKWHAAYPGGGFDHAFGVTECLIELTQKGICRPWQRSISPFIVGLLHDATKINAYVMHQDMNPLTREIETWYDWNPDQPLLSSIHGEDSLLKVQKHLGLTEEEQACIRWHMGAYESTEIWGMYEEAIRKFPNVLWTHTADMYASKVLEVRNEK